MVELVGLYKGMGERQMQELGVGDTDFGIEQTKLEELKKEVEEANLKRLLMEKQFEGT